MALSTLQTLTRIGAAALAALAFAPPVAAQGRGKPRYEPPAPTAAAWIAGQVRLVPLPPDSPLLLEPVPLRTGAAGQFLYGPTRGYDVSFTPDGAAKLQPHGDPRAKPIVVAKPGRVPIPVSHAGAPATPLLVEFVDSAEGWAYRVPVLLQLVFPTGSIFLRDADHDGWFDDLDTDQIAIGAAPKDLVFAAFTGEVALRDARYLLGVNGVAKAGLWPLSRTLRADYARHVAEANALRRFLGLDPAGIAEELTPICEAHARYCAQHGLSHEESPSSPLFSEGGHYAGMHSNLGGGADARVAAIGLLKTLWHRNFYLRGTLARVGVGMAGPPATGEGMSYTPCTSDVLTHSRDTATKPITWPADLARDVWVDGADESPSPYPNGPRPGPFVTVILPRGAARDERVESSIMPRGGTALAHDVTDPLHPPPEARSRFPDNDRSIVLMPHETLAPSTIYDVVITTRTGASFRWSFRTQD